MRVLALDPGYDRLGVAVLEKVDNKETVLFSTCIITDKSHAYTKRLLALGQEYSTILDTHKPDVVAVETLFFSKNVTTAIEVAQARGILLFLAEQAGCEVREFNPQEIKVAITGYGRSDKTAVTDMVKRLVRNVPEKAHDDEYDAIAIAVTALAHHRS